MSATSVATVESSNVDSPAWRLGRRPALDGLRGCAAMLVVAYHITAILVPEPTWHLSGGYLGVDIFFVLSGFLITSLLVQEHDDSRGRVRLGSFYERRALRLLPAVYALIIAQLCYLAIHGGWRSNIGPDLSIVFYFYNWWAAVLARPSPFGLSHLWSLGVEEQFYFVWPVLLVGLLWFRRNTLTITGMLALLAASALSRAALFTHFSAVSLYWQTQSHVDELMVGAIAAILLKRGWRPGRWVRPAAWIGLCVAVYLEMYKGLDYRLLFHDGGLLLFAVAIMMMILGSLEPRGAMYWILSSPPLRFMGRISYSLYLWHGLVLVIIATSWPQLHPRRKAAIMIGVSLACAVASYHGIERPFVSYAHRRQARRAARRAAIGDQQRRVSTV